MLILPAEAADAGLARRLDDGNIKDLPANLVMAVLALHPGEVYKRLVGYSFHKSIAQEANGSAERANLLAIGYALLGFRGGASSIWVNGPDLVKSTGLDDLCR